MLDLVPEAWIHSSAVAMLSTRPPRALSNASTESSGCGLLRGASWVSSPTTPTSAVTRTPSTGTQSAHTEGLADGERFESFLDFVQQRLADDAVADWPHSQGERRAQIAEGLCDDVQVFTPQSCEKRAVCRRVSFYSTLRLVAGCATREQTHTPTLQSNT